MHISLPIVDFSTDTIQWPVLIVGTLLFGVGLFWASSIAPATFSIYLKGLSGELNPSIIDPAFLPSLVMIVGSMVVFSSVMEIEEEPTS